MIFKKICQNCFYLKSKYKSIVSIKLLGQSNIWLKKPICQRIEELKQPFYCVHTLSYKDNKILQINSLNRYLPGASNSYCQKISSSSEMPHTEDTNVYTGQITSLVKGVKLFSLSTSFIGITMQPFLIESLLAKGLIFTIATEFIVFCFAILTPVVLHLVTKRYIVYMLYDYETKKFTMVTLSLFFREKKLHFSADNVLVPDNTGPFTTFTVYGKPFLLDPKQFKDISVYAHLMGYDKPLNLHLHEKH